MEALIVNQSTTPLNAKNIQSILDIVVKNLARSKTLKNIKRLKKDEITFVLVSAGRMKALNFEFRGKDYATDVLSFSSTSPESLGELILCPSVLKKQAKQNGHSLDSEMLYMLIHGILHLLGYDHEKSLVEEKKMFSLQDRLFSRLTESKINLHLTHVNRRRSQ
jgi:probable rRNA maturation factor